MLFLYYFIITTIIHDVYVSVYRAFLFQIEILFLVPPVAVTLCKSQLIQKCQLRSVKRILSGAAPLGKETEDELRKLLNQGAKVCQGITK